MALHSFKLRFHDTHVRLVQRAGETGHDLWGADARAVLTQAGGLRRALEEQAGGQRLRAVSVVLEPLKLTATFEAGSGKPAVLKLSGAGAAPWQQLVAEVAALLGGD